MRKQYDTPVITTSGSVVEDTKNFTPGINEPVGKKLVAGGMGFNL